MPSESHSEPLLPLPHTRLLRVFAFDPSLATEMANFEVSEVLVRIPWEKDRVWEENSCLKSEAGLLPGPVGDYIEVVDVDPASVCVYPPVDLNQTSILAANGLSPSEGNPQFHQQMVYAVAMKTIQHFERALGRQIFWSPREVQQAGGKRDFRPVQRLRIYPHALREENAYYDPDKKALLFGYFPAHTELTADGMPGGMTFSCLSHDIIAHETTHAVLDGMQRYFLDPSNDDVLAFHEAFADIVALFQHFTYSEVLIHQIAKCRGELESESLLGQLAVQFGKSTGGRGALRAAIGKMNPETNRWERIKPDPDAYRTEQEPHARGALLVAAVFDAFLAIYRHRTRDLLRIATGGTGILPRGDIHPDLVRRLSAEAAKSAEHVLTICIRALDYCPPVDITFGDFLRALITADYDLVPDDTRNYRIAFIEAFRAWSIYPRDVRTLSVDSLRWGPPAKSPSVVEFSRLLRPIFFTDHLERLWDEICNARIHPRTNLQAPIRKLTRMEISERILWFSGGFHDEVKRHSSALFTSGALGAEDRPFGLNFAYGHDKDSKFEVHQVRPVHRQGLNGRAKLDLLVQITQRRPGYLNAEKQRRENERYLTAGHQRSSPSTQPDFWFRGGVTLIMDLETFEVRYAVQKDVISEDRLERQRLFMSKKVGTSLRSLYFGDNANGRRLAALHACED